jgi:hypothetical protein
MKSVPKKLCINTLKEILDSIEVCNDCGEIPLPGFRTSKNEGNYFCNGCFEKRKFDIKSKILPTKSEMNLLKKLNINCKYLEKGCHEYRGIQDLNSLLEHEKNCQYSKLSVTNLKEGKLIINETDKRCIRCSYYHDNSTECLKLVKEEAKDAQNNIVLVNQQISFLGFKLMKQFDLLNNKIDTSILKIEEKIEKNQKQVSEMSKELKTFRDMKDQFKTIYENNTEICKQLKSFKDLSSEINTFNSKLVHIDEKMKINEEH